MDSRNLKFTLLISFVVLLSAFSADTVFAYPLQKLLGTVGVGDNNSSGTTNSMLVQINPNTGELMKEIGLVGYLVNGLAYDASRGKLYGSLSAKPCKADPDGCYQGLIEIDMLTGEGTPVGANTWGGLWDAGDNDTITNLAIDSEGNMFGWWDPDVDDLVSIDPDTGIATLMGDSGVSTGGNSLAFTNTDSLYLTNPDNEEVYLYAVDVDTGETTELVTLDEDVIAHHGVFDLNTNLFYAISGPENDPGAWMDETDGRSIVIINWENQTVVAILPTVDLLHTLAFVPAMGGGGGDSWSCFINTIMGTK